ncbi:MAG: hypothetical protein HYX20_00065 [Candidatus Yanofskybacteria bacterium]|nr:hypothetical protein [Candidatus Yanofskybacteria bacterium]
MNKTSSFKIIERPNVIDDHLLDIIGREFKFDHEKGLAELMKNSVDAYLRVDMPDSEQYIIFRFTDGSKDDGTLECIDFVGMSEADIEKAFIRWGDPEAARRGLGRRVYGGHGNGGKFYMRQMFDSSYFITYRDGRLSVFGFNTNKKYGFADGYQNEKVKPEEALKFADLKEALLFGDLKNKILNGKTGFTVVRGIGPVGMKNRIKTERIAERMKNHPQARRLLLHKHVSVIHNGEFLYDILRPDEIKTLPDFKEPIIAEIPESLIMERDGEKGVIELANKKYSPGRLILKTSEEALQGGRYGDLNRIDIIGEVGESDKTVIASYELYELGVRTFPQAAFIYGECACPILEDPDNDCVKNDRTKLVSNDTTKTLLEWIRGQVDGLATLMASKEAESQKETTRKISSAYNEFLNQWKNRWMRKILSEMFLKGSEESGGGFGKGKMGGKLEAPVSGFEFRFAEADIPLSESYPLTLKASVPKTIPIGGIITTTSDNALIEVEDARTVIKSDSVKLTEDGDEVAVINIHVLGKKLEEEALIVAKTGKYTTQIKIKVVEALTGGGSRKSRYPKVLLSGHDSDPLGLSKTVILSPRHSVVHQRFEDVKEGIYWINTQSPLAVAILNKHDVHSPRWRDYLFQRYVEIFMKEALYELQKRDPETFRADRIDNDIFGELVRKVHTAAAEDLEQFLFNEEYPVTGYSEENENNT